MQNFGNEDFEKYDSNQLRDLLLKILEHLQVHRREQKIFIFLDSIDQLVKEDYALRWMPIDYPSNTKFVYSFVDDYHEALTKNVKNVVDIDFNKEDGDHFLKVSKFDSDEAIKVLEEMLKKSNKNLKQFRKIKKLLKKSENYPLFVKMIYNIVSRWPSYYEPDDEFKQIKNMDDCIQYIFISLERDFGTILVSRCLYYLTSNGDSGISDIEMEDALSLDEELLNSIFEFHRPPEYPNIKFPSVLWNRVKLFLRDFITVKEIDQTQVYCW